MEEREFMMRVIKSLCEEFYSVKKYESWNGLMDEHFSKYEDFLPGEENPLFDEILILEDLK